MQRTFVHAAHVALLVTVLAGAVRAAEPLPTGAKPPPTVPTLDILRSNLEQSYIAPVPLVVDLQEHASHLLWLEVNVAPPFLVGRKAWPVAFELTPKILVRMFMEESAPVKTPSYMPRFTVYWLPSTEFTGATTFYGSATISHHSNGQAGSFFDPDGSVNHDTGNFSTNYLEATAHVAWGEKNALRWLSPSLEWHPGFNQSDELKGVYGFWRAHVAYTAFHHVLLDGKLSLRLSGILDRVALQGDSEAVKVLRRFPFAAKYTVKVPGVDIGAYVGGYVGPDYYNISFDRYVAVLQLGLVGDASPQVPELADDPAPSPGEPSGEP